MKTVLGVDIGGTKTSVCLGSEAGDVICKRQFLTAKEPDAVIDAIWKCGTQIMSEQSIPALSAIGISCGGPLDTHNGLILSPPHLSAWKAYPVVEKLSSLFRIRAFLQNDANACAVAEWKWGAGRGSRNMVFFTFGTGFGAGLILNGALYEGSSCMAGEIGHIRISSRGPFCYGKKGCVESFCSGEGLGLLYQQYYGRKLSGKDICLLAEKGDAKALRVIGVSSRKLGQVLAGVIDFVNPEVVVIGSIFTRDEQLFRSTVERVVAREALPQSLCVCSIRPSQLGEELGDKAAISIALAGLSQEG